MNESFKESSLRVRVARLEMADVRSYFDQLEFVSERMLRALGLSKQAKVDLEHEAIVRLFEKLRVTFTALRKKYGHNLDEEIEIDVVGSGFPSQFEIQKIHTDLETKEITLGELPTSQMLKQEMLDHMFESLEEPGLILSKMGTRAYCKFLERESLFLTYAPGELTRLPDKDGARRYLYSWGCYDFASNKPSIYVLLFEHDTDAIPLEKGGPNKEAFLRAVQAEGSRTPGLAIVAIGIDNALDEIHPKYLRRITLGPLNTKRFGSQSSDMQELLAVFGSDERDFVLLGEDEIVFSLEQQVIKGFFSFGKKREVFYLPVTDQECFERKVSKVHSFMILPHALLQNARDREAFKATDHRKKLTYDEQGGVHGI